MNVTPTTPPRPAEPLAISNVLQLVIATAVAAGWATADDPVWPLVGTAAGAIASVVVLLKARARTRPIPKQ